MNCKQGDLAVVVRTEDPGSPALGKIVEVCSYAGEHSVYGPMWLVRTNGHLVATIHGTSAITFHSPDAWLRPIRDTDGEDETLTWAGKPETVDA